MYVLSSFASSVFCVHFLLAFLYYIMISSFLTSPFNQRHQRCRSFINTHFRFFSICSISQYRSFTIHLRYTTLLSSKKLYFIPLRFMLTRNCLGKTANLTLLSKNNQTWILTKQAHRRANQPDPYPKDTQALKNNPHVWNNISGKFVRHIEFSRLECTDLDCIKKDCPVLCGPCKKITTIGCATHGNPQTSTGRVYTLDQTEDIDGNKKAQKIVMFDLPHKTGLAPMHQKGTDFINKGPKAEQRRKTIIDHEKDHD